MTPTAPLTPGSAARTLSVAVAIPADERNGARARALAAEFGFPLVTQDPARFPLTLAYGADGLMLVDQRARRRSLRIDFAPLGGTRRGARLTRRDPLARAIGRQVRTLVDATAGLGTDAMRLACFGLSVVAIERVAAIYALLRDAQERAGAMPTLADCAARLQLAQADALNLLPTLVPAPDAVYIDPMFPPKRRRSAATRKELALLRELAGEDLDATQLLAVSRSVARERVIVKRPDDQPPLAPKPTVSYGGKLVRYDVYRTDLS